MSHLGHRINQYKLRQHLPCLKGPKFHASEASGSEEEDFNIFLSISMVQTQDTLERSHIEPLGYYVTKLDIRPQGNILSE